MIMLQANHTGLIRKYNNTMAILKDTIINGDINVSGSVGTSSIKDTPNIQVGQRSLSSHLDNTLIQIKARKIGLTVYLGVPDTYDLTDDYGVTIKYLRYSSVRMRSFYNTQGGGRITLNTQKKWHALRNMSKTNRYIPSWNKDKDLINFILDLDEDRIEIIHEDGYYYYGILGACIQNNGNDTYSKVYVPLISYVGLSESPTQTYFLPVNESTNVATLLSHKKAGICLWANGRPISNIVELRVVDCDCPGWIIEN